MSKIRFQSGKQYQHGIMIDKIYGEGTALNLMRYGNMVCKRNQSDLINMIEHYKQIGHKIYNSIMKNFQYAMFQNLN